MWAPGSSSGADSTVWMLRVGVVEARRRPPGRSRPGRSGRAGGCRARRRRRRASDPGWPRAAGRPAWRPPGSRATSLSSYQAAGAWKCRASASPLAPSRPPLGQLEVPPEALGQVAAGQRPVEQHREHQPPGDDRDLSGRDRQRAQLGEQRERALLGHQQQIAVGVVQRPAVHVAVGAIQVDGAAPAQLGRAGAGDGHQAVQEIPGLVGVGQRRPAGQVHLRRAAGEAGAEAAGAPAA